jgi:hypothetical protein
VEPDFYSIALAKLLQTVPELGNYIVTFKDVSEDLNENSDIKVGVFILRVGQEIFYVPVVSKMDNVYPVDSIFFTSTGQFMPITKKTTETIITSSKLSQGKPTKIPSTAPANPDVTSMINPPRTGKFVYASASRLGDFLAGMPDYLKQFTMEKIAEEKSVYENLHKLFAIRDIFSALKAAPQSMAARTNAAPISVVTGAATNLSQGEIAAILEHGYAVKGHHTSNRVALAAKHYSDHKYSEISEVDGNSDYELLFSNGTSREAFIPKMFDTGQNSGSRSKTVAMFTNGDYAIDQSFIATGDKLDRKLVLDVIFDKLPPVLPRDVEIGDTFAIIDVNANLGGIFRAHKVMLSNLGVEISVSTEAGAGNCTTRINAYRNYGVSPSCQGHEMYIPFSSLVLKLGENVTGELERSVNSAARRREITEAGLLGDQLNLGYDGIEFTVNGSAVGDESAMMSKLAVDEGIDPALASSFIKQAKEKKFAKVYLSKRASEIKPAEMPQFGQALAPAPKVGLNGSFMPNVQNALKVSDAQTTEATIISELLQTPDMHELIEEYLPDIEECVDKLGRILFLSRVHISKLAENNDADSVFAFLANLKAVYRMLGDNLFKLRELIAIKPVEM